MTRKLIDVECTLVHETDKAVLIETHMTKGSGSWVPKSLCEVEQTDPLASMPCPATITLSEDLAIDKELV